MHIQKQQNKTTGSATIGRSHQGAAPKDRSFLGTEPIGRLLIRLAIPTVIAQLVNMLYNIIDRIYIGHIPESGSLALTGLGVCFPVILMISAFASLVSSGGAPRASIHMGKGDYDTAEKILGECFFTLCCIAITLTVILSIWHRDLLLAFGASDNTIPYAAGYMRIYALGTIFVQLTLGMNAFITAQGFTKQSMTTVIIGAVCNIILDPVFIFVLKMGVAGAAAATVISQGISCLWVIRFLTGKDTALRIRREHLRFEKETVLPCIALGSAAFIMQSSESIMNVCFNSSLLKYGGDIAVGAMTINSSVMQFAMLPLSGLGQGAQPISSFNYGAGKGDRVTKTFKTLLKVCLTYSIIFWAILMAVPGLFAGIFTSDAALIAFSSKALRIYGAMICLIGIQMSCQHTFVAISYAKCAIIVACVRKFVLLIPLIYIVPLIVNDKTMGVYLAEPIADLLAITFTATLFSIAFKKAMEKLKSKAL